jgi:hypothetical protein
MTSLSILCLLLLSTASANTIRLEASEKTIQFDLNSPLVFKFDPTNIPQPALQADHQHYEHDVPVLPIQQGRLQYFPLSTRRRSPEATAEQNGVGKDAAHQIFTHQIEVANRPILPRMVSLEGKDGGDLETVGTKEREDKVLEI